MVQTVFLRVWRQRAKHPLHRITRAYLFRAVRNESSHVIDRERMADPADSRRAESSRSPPTPLDELEMVETLGVIRAAVEGLLPRCKQIFLLVREEGMTYAEAADELDIGVKSVEKHMSHALGVLRAAIAAMEDDPREGEVG